MELNQKIVTLLNEQCDNQVLIDKVGEFGEVVSQIELLKEAWQIFVGTGELANGQCIRPEVYSSWKRSKKRGIDPYNIYPISLTPKNLEKRLAENREIIDIASQFLEALVLNVKGSGFRIDLLDKDLYILKQFGEPGVLETAKKQGSYPGIIRSEEVTGTNAINLAAILGHPIQLVGPEHYNAHLHYWTCSATPLYDENRKLLGVVNVAGHHSKIHPHTLGMINALGRAIEFSLQQNHLRTEKELTTRYIEGILNSISDGIVAINGSGLITFMNQTAGDLLDVTTKEVLNQSAEAVLGSQATVIGALKNDQTIINKELAFYSKNKQKIVIGNVMPVVSVDHQVEGVVAVFKKLSQARGLVKTLVGFKAHFNFSDLIGGEPRFLQIINLASQAATMPSNIFISGESGTGKEIFAQAIHNASSAKEEPFLGINCAAIPTELIESELFGYDGGAFSGAKREGQQGKFQLAAGGTLFFDEINSMSISMQAKLLRVLQNRSFSRVGGVCEIPLEARILAASNRDLWEEVKNGNFREDLFYRLNVITLEIPPLRERKLDITLLVEHFCKKHSERLKLDFAVSERALKIMMEYKWPGNVRELENVIERCAVLAYSRSSHLIEEEDVLSYRGIKNCLSTINEASSSTNGAFVIQDNLHGIEKWAVVNAFRHNGGNITKTAKGLGISRKTLYRKLKEYDILVRPVN